MSTALLKKMFLLTGLLLVVLLVYYYRQVPHFQVPFAKAAGSVERILLEQGPKKIELHKEGKLWQVFSPTSAHYPADENAVKTFISTLKDVQIEDQISDRADRASEYEVNSESGTRVCFMDASGTKLAEGIFGKQAPDVAHLYFRYPDKPNVYLARGLIRGELGQPELNSWRSRQLIDLPETGIQEVLIQGKGFATDLVRKGTDTWTLNGKVLEPAPVYQLLGALGHLSADEFVTPSTAPVFTYDSLQYAKIAIKTADRTVELHIGPEWVQQQKYPAAVSAEGGVAWLYELHVKPLLLKPSDFHIK